MKIRALFAFILLLAFATSNLDAQTPQWTTLPMPPAAVRYDDCFFITPDIGWSIHPFNIPYGTDTTTEQGRIWKTTDAGASWILQLDSSHMYFRSIGFADSLHGWVGNLGYFYDSVDPVYDSLNKLYDSTLMYETTDGGNSWQSCEKNIIGTKPAGICGICVVNHDIVYAVGRFPGPCYLLKTRNGGKSWNSIDMNSLAGGLVDCYFWSADSGIIVGQTLIHDSVHSALILFTSDGGNHWVKRFEGTGINERCWKISFPSQDIGYVSVESGYRGYLLKTTNKGVTWKQVMVPNSYILQGVGFLDDSVGWTGGWDNSSTGYVTTNGGKNWKTAGIGKNINRFHFFGDSLGYCSGQSIFKMTLSKPNGVKKMMNLSDLGNHPNPFINETTIHFSIPKAEHVTVDLYDLTGKELIKVLDENRDAGEYDIPLKAILPAGTFYYILSSGSEQLERKMIRLK